jgi:hypothetical protein
MKRRAFLTAATVVSCAGCVTVDLGGSDESTSVDDRESTESPADDGESTESPADDREETEREPTEVEEGPDPSEQPIIHELSLDSDPKWLMMGRRYEVPNAGNEFTITERWHITDADGGTVLEEEREEEVETDRDIESVLVSGGTWYIPRWDYNIQQGEYTVELVIVGANGAESNPERRTITIDSDPTE